MALGLGALSNVARMASNHTFLTALCPRTMAVRRLSHVGLVMWLALVELVTWLPTVHVLVAAQSRANRKVSLSLFWVVFIWLHRGSFDVRSIGLTSAFPFAGWEDEHKRRDAQGVIQAERYDRASNLWTAEAQGLGSGTSLHFARDPAYSVPRGSWARFDGVDFGAGGTVCVAKRGHPNFELCWLA